MSNQEMNNSNAFHGGQNQGNRVHFQEQTYNDVDMSDHLPDQEEVHDIVHDLQGNNLNDIALDHSPLGNIDHKKRGRSHSNQNVSRLEKRLSAGGNHYEENLPIIENMEEMSAEDAAKFTQQQFSVTPYTVNMESSVHEFGKHVSECNLDFKENVLRKIQTIKLKDTSELNKKVEELKQQEA